MSTLHTLYQYQSRISFVRGGLTGEAKDLIGFLNKKSWDELPDEFKMKAQQILCSRQPQGFVSRVDACLLFSK